MLIKALRNEEEDNAKLIKDLSKKWDMVEAMVRNQVQESKSPRAIEMPGAIEIPRTIEISRTIEVPRAVEVLTLAMGDSKFLRQAPTTKSLRFQS